MSQVTQYIENMALAIFQNRQADELKIVAREIAESEADHIQRGMRQSGAFILSLTRIYEAAVIRTIEKTLEELYLQFRHAGRKDSTLFWNAVEPKIKNLALSFSQSATATIAQKLQGMGGTAATQHGTRSFALIGQMVTSRVHELRLKTEFIILKTPDDRRANGIPDIAVMMWFPDVKLDGPDAVAAAQERYEAIKDAVKEASGGLATVNKFDDPSVVPQDRISASIEVWLEKAVLVICDLAGQRQNVYYEFGFTRAVGTDVLLTCPLIDAENTKLHLGHWQRIHYADNVELKKSLIEKMKTILPKYDLSGSI